MNIKALESTQNDCSRVTSDNRELKLSLLKNSSILITGGTGFIGTWITELILHLNREYSFNTQLTLMARDTEAFIAKYPHLTKESFLTLLSIDTRNLIDLPNDINYLVHAASNPDSREHSLNPLQIIDSIVNGTTNVFEKCTRLNNLNKVLNISSGLVYGVQPLDLESLSEDYFGSLDCAHVSSVYSESKRLSETIGTAYRTQHRLPIVTTRPFTFVGPYQSLEKPWAINNFMRDAMLGGPIKILGSGDTQRSYMYGADAAFWILSMLVNGRIGGCYNLGSPTSISLNALALKITSEFSPMPEIKQAIQDGKDKVISRFIPNTTLAADSLGLEIVFNIDEAIHRTIQWNKMQ